MPFYPDRNWEEVFQTGQFFTPRVIQMLMELDAQVRAGGGSGSVNSVAAEDGSIVVDGTATDPTIRTGTLDVIATLHAAAADWSNAGFKITGLAAGVAPTDAANVSQVGGGSGSRTATASVGAADAEAPTDWDYTCDGTADQAEILAAIAALPAGGGRVILSEGTFNITATIVIDKSNVTLEGQGTATQIVLGNAVNADAIALGTAAGSFTNITVRNLYVDGNSANQTGTTGRNCIHAKSDVTYARIDGCYAYNSRYDNILVDGPDAQVTNCTATVNVAGDNIEINGARALVLGCRAITSSNSNIGLYSGSTGSRVEGNYCTGASVRGIWSETLTDAIGNYVVHNVADYAIYLNNDYCSVVGNVVSIGASGWRGIRVARFPTVSNNLIVSASTVNTAYCIYHNSRGAVISGNICHMTGDTGSGNAGCIAVDEESTCIGNSCIITGDRAMNGIEDLAGNSTFTGNSVYFFTGAGGTYNAFVAAQNSVYNNNIVVGALGTVTAFRIPGVDRVIVTGNQIIQPVNGIVVEDGTDYAVVTNNMIQGAATTLVGISLDNSTYCTVNDNTLTGIRHDALTLARSSFNSVNGNKIVDCGQTTNDTYSGIKLSASAGVNSTYNTVENNTINSTTANKLKYGIEENDSSQGPNIVTGNIVLGSVTAQILVQHTSTDYSHNITS